jgi:hypothetical protein
MADVPRVLNELIRRLTEMRDAYQNIPVNPHARTPIDNLLLEKIDVWTRNTGSSFGNLAEFDQYYRNRTLKNRLIVTAKNTGDVVIGGQGDPFAKTIQSKAITSQAHNSVDGHIDKAIEQIAGLYHESPRKSDHLSVNIIIFNDENSWPFTPAESKKCNGCPPLAETLARTMSQVRASLARTLGTNASNATNSLAQNLARGEYLSNAAPGPKTRAQHRVVSDFHPAHGAIVRYYVTPTFYVKINWPFGYYVDDQGTRKLLKTAIVRYNTQAKDLEVLQPVFHQ